MGSPDTVLKPRRREKPRSNLAERRRHQTAPPSFLPEISLISLSHFSQTECIPEALGWSHPAPSRTPKISVEMALTAHRVTGPASCRSCKGSKPAKRRPHLTAGPSSSRRSAGSHLWTSRQWRLLIACSMRFPCQKDRSGRVHLPGQSDVKMNSAGPILSATYPHAASGPGPVKSLQWREAQR